MLTRRKMLSPVGPLSALAALTSPAAANQDGDDVITFEMDELVSERAASGRPYLPFLNLPTLRCGLYVLPAAGEDKQSPHETDEVYYVVSGRAKIRVEGDVRSVSPGSVIYVKAGAEHRFIDIEEEIRLLVFFD